MNLHLFFVLPEAIALCILVWHSVTTRGKRETLLFFGSGLIYFSVKENITALNLFQHGRYSFNQMPMKVFNAPFFVIAGWIFAAYLSLSLAEGIAKRIKGDANELVVVLVLSIFITSSIAYAVEVCGVSGGWWDWPYHRKTAGPNPRVVYGIYTPIYGWSRFINGFVAPFLLFQRTKLRLKRGKTFFMFLTFALILASLMTRFYNFLITGIIETALFFAAMFYRGVKLKPPANETRNERSWVARFGVLTSSLLMLSVCLMVDITARAPLMVFVSTFAFITFLLLYTKVIDFRIAGGLFILTRVLNAIFNLPQLGFSLIQIAAVIVVMLVRKVLHRVLIAGGRDPRALSPALFRGLCAVQVLVWLIITVFINHGNTLRAWQPEWGP